MNGLLNEMKIDTTVSNIILDRCKLLSLVLKKTKLLLQSEDGNHHHES